jgi:protein TonB
LISSVKSRPNHYETLGLTPTASGDDIAEAFATKSSKHIADPRATEPDMRELARQIRIAHETLRDPVRRRAYDDSLGLTSEAEPHRPEEPAEPSAVPFMAAPPPKPAKQRARGKSRDLESQLQPEERPQAKAAPKADRHIRKAPSDSVKRRARKAAGKLPAQQERPPKAPAQQSAGAFMAATTRKPAKQRAHEASPDHSSQWEPQRPKAPTEPNVALFIAAALRDPIKRRAYYAPPGRSPQPEPQPRPEPPSERSSDSHIERNDEPHRIYVNTSVPDVDEPRPKLNRTAAAVAALLVAVALFALLMWPLGGNADRTPSTPRGRTASSIGGPPIASNAITQAPQQTPPVQDNAFQVPDETDASLYGSVAPSDTGPVPTRIASEAASAPVGASIPQGAVETPPAPKEETGPTVATTDPAAAAPPLAAGRLTPPASATQAVVAEAARTAPPPALNRATPARLMGGALTDSDNRRGRFEGTVSVRFTVDPSGQVTGCQPTATSGNPALDARTCELVAQRLQFSPGLDAQGHPVAWEMRATYTWARKHRSLAGRMRDLVRKRRP